MNGEVHYTCAILEINELIYVFDKKNVYLLIHKLLLQGHVHTLATQIIHWNIYPQGVQDSRGKKKEKKKAIKAPSKASHWIKRAVHIQRTDSCVRFSELFTGAQNNGREQTGRTDRMKEKEKDTKQKSRVREGRGGQRAVRSEVWCS